MTVDSLRGDRVGYAGHAAAQTPSIDALAARGTAWMAALAPVPEAVPSLVSLHTGLYPIRHGVRESQGAGVPHDVPGLAGLLKGKGYRTGAFVAALSLHPKYGLDRGFDVYGASFAEEPRPSQISEVGVPAAEVADRAIEFLETAREGPFFLWVNFYDPHYFYAPPEPFATRFATSPYDGEVAYVDRELGRLLAKLKDFGIEGRTVVALAGANGEGLGDGGEEYHGTTLRQAAVRVPLVIAGPSFEPGARVDAGVSLVDVAPTLLRALDVDPPAGLDGVALQTPADPSRPLYLETTIPRKLFGWEPLTGVVEGSWKYVAGTRGELFDLKADPAEGRDVSAEHPDIRGRLAGLVASYQGRGRPTPPMPGAAAAAIRELGMPVEAKPRAARDPRDMTGVANDALKAARTARRRQLQAALFLYQGVLQRDPENLAALIDSALLARSRRDTPEERRLLDRAQQLHPGSAEVYHELGHTVMTERRQAGMETANRLFEIAMLLDPKHEEALYDVACARSVRGEKTAALETLERAVQEGFRDFEWMSQDGDLDAIRAEPRFEAITMGKAKSKAKQPAAGQ